MFLGELFLYLTWPLLILISVVAVQMGVNAFEKNVQKKNDG